MTITSNGSTAPEILQAAIAEMEDRAVTYDKPQGERSMEATVEAFKAVTGHDLTETQGWLFMAILKAVRSQQGAYRADSYVDGAAYFGLAGEAAAREEAENAELCQMAKRSKSAMSSEDIEQMIRGTIGLDGDWPESRIDIIAASGGQGEHYDAVKHEFNESANFDPVPLGVDDPRNWRAGDLVECNKSRSSLFAEGHKYPLREDPQGKLLVEDDSGQSVRLDLTVSEFRFHSRPS